MSFDINSAIVPITGKVIMTTEGGGGHVPAFLSKLWKIVDEKSTDDLICWNETGSGFVIRDQAKFAHDLLPLYYKHNNMASFVRQLNMYGFHKVVSVEQGGLKVEKDEMEFAHPFFIRGHEDTLELIKRKMPASKHEGDIVLPESINKIITDVRQVKGRQDSMDSKLMTMKRENEALWRELSTLRQKHAKQQQIVSKLLQFLVNLMSSQTQQHRIPYKRRMPLMINDVSQTDDDDDDHGHGHGQVGMKPIKRKKNNNSTTTINEATISELLDSFTNNTSSDPSDSPLQNSSGLIIEDVISPNPSPPSPGGDGQDIFVPTTSSLSTPVNEYNTVTFKTIRDSDPLATASGLLHDQELTDPIPIPTASTSTAPPGGPSSTSGQTGTTTMSEAEPSTEMMTLIEDVDGILPSVLQLFGDNDDLLDFNFENENEASNINNTNNTNNYNNSN